MRTSKLFVYGQLKPGSKYAVHSILKPEKAQIDASMYKLKNDVGIKRLNHTSHITEGYIVTVPTSKLPSLDKEESPQFKRQKGSTTQGTEVWIYAYKDKIPKNEKPIKNFKVKK